MTRSRFFALSIRQSVESGERRWRLSRRIALETGLSLWGAIGEVVRRQLGPQRALTALRSFRDLIEDARAMLARQYEQRLSNTAAPQAQVEIEVAPTDGAGDEISFDPTDFNISFDFGPTDEEVTAEESAATPPDQPAEDSSADGVASEPTSAPVANTGELLKFLIDRTGYIKQLEAEDTPEAFSRVENLHELVNAAMDSRDRAKTLDQFLDHAALVSDADGYDEQAKITLMTLHAAKGLEFPLVFLCGLEEGLFPHSRTFNQPDDVEEERRLCYVGMTRAMDTLMITRAIYRRRYGTDLPEASVPSRFLEEIPPALLEELGTARRAHVGASRVQAAAGRSAAYDSSAHYAYEDEDQSLPWATPKDGEKGKSPSAPKYNSIDNITEFFASRGKKFNAPKMAPEAPKGRSGFRPGQRVRHPKYGEGTVFQREGEGEDSKITVQFSRFGLKKLVEKYAQQKGLNSKSGNFVVGKYWGGGSLPEPGICRLRNLQNQEKVFMANTSKLSKDDRKKAKRASRKKTKADKPKKPRDYARGSKKSKVKKLVRGQAKR